MSVRNQAGPAQSCHPSQLRWTNSSQAALNAHTDTEGLMVCLMLDQSWIHLAMGMSGHTLQ